MNTLQNAVDTIKDNRDIALSDTTRDSGIQRSIREAIVLLKGKRYWFLQKNFVQSVDENNTQLTLPSDFAMGDSFDLLYNGRRYTHREGFDQYDYQDFKRIFLYNVTLAIGQPVACALMNRTLYWNKQIDRNDAAIDITYFCQDATLPTAPTDTSVMFGDDSFDVVVSLGEHIFERRTMQNMEADAEITKNYQAILLERHEQYDRARIV